LVGLIGLKVVPARLDFRTLAKLTFLETFELPNEDFPAVEKI